MTSNYCEQCLGTEQIRNEEAKWWWPFSLKIKCPHCNGTGREPPPTKPTTLIPPPPLPHKTSIEYSRRTWPWFLSHESPKDSLKLAKTEPASCEQCSMFHIAKQRKPLWICGRVHDDNRDKYAICLNLLVKWEVIGIFETEELAVAACSREEDFIGKIFLNKVYGDEITELEGYYPLLDVVE